MREIKFRGLDEYGNWIFGGYFENSEEEGLIKYIFTDYDGAISVYYNTVGQFTGLTDKNGKDIYENDVDKSGNIIRWNNNKSMFCLFHKDGNIASYPLFSNELEVIGNIHENPELLK